MCDASNSTPGAILGQRVDKQPHMIANASRTMDNSTFKDKKGAENVVVNHLSWLERDVEPIPI
ncbi:hypothetical protein CR513_16080, partial [Mucuna pruriens]